MKSKTLAIFGIGTYILSVITSATDLEGNSVVPIFLIAISGIATAVFIIMATIRLWKISKISSILLVSSTIILLILSVVQVVVSPSYGSPLIILFNITRVINFIAFIWAVSLLLAMAKQEGLAKKT
jgi:glucan phosphoethanolaminetransferase (alkaline phosphatase superfamily)